MSNSVLFYDIEMLFDVYIYEMKTKFVLFERSLEMIKELHL